MATNSAPKTLSVREFAKQIGTSHTAVQKAIKAGKLTKGYNAQTKRINPSVAKNDAWVQQQSIVKPKPGVSRAKALEKLSGTQQDKVPGNENTTDLPGLPKDIEDMNTAELLACMKIASEMPLGQAIRYREVIALALDKIKLQKEEGILVEKEKVENVLFAFGTMMKKALLNIPARVVDDLLAAPSKVDAINILTDEINEVLRVFSSMKEMKVRKPLKRMTNKGFFFANDEERIEYLQLC